MLKFILVPATGADSDAPVFATALAVARLLGSHLEFLHVRIDVQQALMAMASADMGGGVGYGEILTSLEQDAAGRQKKAELAFHDFCEREKLSISTDLTTYLPSAEWRLEVGEEPAWLAEYGRTADLLVVGRAREGEPVAMNYAGGLPYGNRPSGADCTRQRTRLAWQEQSPSPGRTDPRLPGPSRPRDHSWRSRTEW